jgi:hypothetical protein
VGTPLFVATITLKMLISELAQFDSHQGGPEQGTQGMEEGQAHSCERLQLTYLFKRA